MANISFQSLISQFLWENKHIAFAYVVMLILIPLQDIGIPHVIGKVMRTVRETKFDFKYIYVLMLLMLCGQVSVSMNDFIESRLYPKLQTFISDKVVSYIADTCKLNMQDILTGRILAMLSNTPKTMYNFLDTWRSLLIPKSIVSLVAIVYFTIHQKLLGLVLVVVVILYYILLYVTIRQCGGTAMERERFLLSVNDEIDDVFTNMIAIFNSNKMEDEKNRVRSYFKAYELLSISALKCTMKLKYMIVPIIIILGMTFIIIGFRFVKNGTLALETFIAMLLIFMYVFGAILRSVNVIKDTAIRYGMIKQNLEIFNSMQPAKAMPMTLDKRLNDKAFIRVDNVTLSYRNKQVLDHFSMEIKEKENVLIIGHIGKGKTTILKLLMRYQQPNSGTIYIKGVPVQNIPIKTLRSRIGFIPQNPVLLNRTLYENITYNNPSVSKQQVLDLLSTLKLTHIFDADRLDANVGKHGSKLSGGQRQVVWILRVFLQNPEIILMDEPTASIDNDTKAYIFDLFKFVMKDRTTIVVSHDMSMASLCDRTISLSS
jgi:ABC-type multidrug transport system fused ATPase/permease subunit